MEVAAATSKGDIQSVVVQKVSRNEKTDLTEFVVRTTIKNGTSLKWVTQASSQVTQSGIDGCKKLIGKTCDVDKKVVFAANVKRMVFTAIPVNGGESISLVLFDPYQWDVVKAVIMNVYSTGALVLLCENKFGTMDRWSATRADRDVFVSAYKVKKWTTVFAFAVNDAGTVLSFVGVSPGPNAARNLAVDLVAPMIWDQVLNMPSVTLQTAMSVGNMTMGYKISEYLNLRCK